MIDIYDIAASGMAAQRTELDLIGENLANAGMVRADGSVYHPRSAVIQSTAPFESVLQDAAVRMPSVDSPNAAGDFLSGFEEQCLAAGVTVAGVVERSGAPTYKLDPGSPLAQKTVRIRAMLRFRMSIPSGR